MLYQDLRSWIPTAVSQSSVAVAAAAETDPLTAPETNFSSVTPPDSPRPKDSDGITAPPTRDDETDDNDDDDEDNDDDDGPVPDPSKGSATRGPSGRPAATSRATTVIVSNVDQADTEIKEADYEALDDDDGLIGPELSRMRDYSRVDSIELTSDTASDSRSPPPKAPDRTFSQKDAPLNDEVDIYVFCAQECDYAPRADPSSSDGGLSAAMSVAGSSSNLNSSAVPPPLSSAGSQGLSSTSSVALTGVAQKRYHSCKEDWLDTLKRHIGADKYSLLAYHHMWQIRIAVRTTAFFSLVHGCDVNTRSSDG